MLLFEHNLDERKQQDCGSVYGRVPSCSSEWAMTLSMLLEARLIEIVALKLRFHLETLVRQKRLSWLSYGDCLCTRASFRCGRAPWKSGTRAMSAPHSMIPSGGRTWQ